MLLEELVHLAELGIDTAIGAVPGAHEIAPIEAIGRHVIPAVAEL